MATGIIIFLISMMVLGSIVWIKPSKRERRMAEFRAQAMSAGLKVRLDGVEAEPVHSGIREDIPGASYILFVQKPDKKDKANWMVVSDEGWMQDGLPQGWSWHTKEAETHLWEKISALIEATPIPIIAIERTPAYSRIVWQELPVAFNAEELKQYLQTVQATF